LRLLSARTYAELEDMVLAHFPLDPTGKRTDGLRDLRSLLTVWERATDYPRSLP